MVRRPELERMPALDGLRGVAVAAVLLYHGGVSWAGGGFLGVEAFFVLSGFLITSLLVVEWTRDSTIRLRAFWARRARRLLPALFCLVAAVGVYQAVAGWTHAVPGLEGQGIATLLYYGNWYQVFTGSSYFVSTGPVSPLQHTWSLAIEEQFYLVWPLFLLGFLKLITLKEGRHGSAARRRLALGALCVLSLLGAVASATEMALLYQGGSGVNRVYYGTDTRAQALLVGAALAFALALARELRAAPREARPATTPAEARPRSRLARLASPIRTPLLAVLGLAGAAALGAAFHLASGTSSAMYHYGFLAVDAAVVSIIAAAILVPASPVGRVLAFAPLRAVGIVSYGLYLWHFPLYQWLTEASTGISQPALLLLLRLGASGVVSVASYFLVEQPIRRRRVPRRHLLYLAPTGFGLAALSVVLAAAVDVPPVASQVPPPEVVASVPKTATSCSLHLADTSTLLEAPLPGADYYTDFLRGLSSHDIDFGDKKDVEFPSCPPERVLVVADSIAYSLVLGMLPYEQLYGVELAGAPLLGCAFHTMGELDLERGWSRLYSQCASEDERWKADEEEFRPDAVVIELGWRDSFDWLVDGHEENLGDPDFDASVLAGMDQFVQTLGAGGVPILFLTVPWAAQPAAANGSPPPEVSPQRHDAINALMMEVAARHPGQVAVLDINQYISPGGHYNSSVDGQLCRYDGVHFTPFCAALLEAPMLQAVKSLVARAPSTSAKG